MEAMRAGDFSVRLGREHQGPLGRISVLFNEIVSANQNMAQLTEELTSTENKVAFARQAYNDAVTAYNTYRESFPLVFFASLFGHGESAELQGNESVRRSYLGY